VGTLTHKEIAKRIIKVLKREGAVVHRYDAFTSNSIYIKIDAGIVGTVRISDHLSNKGRKKLGYRYNLLTNLDEFYVQKEPNVRYFYPTQDLDIMIGNILARREAKLAESHGDFIYQQQIRNEIHKRRKQPGFWQRAVVV
jgi:hypothetical protein